MPSEINWPMMTAKIKVGSSGVGYTVDLDTEGQTVLSSTLTLTGKGEAGRRAMVQLATDLLMHPFAKERDQARLTAHGSHEYGPHEYEFRWKAANPLVLLARQIVIRNMHDRDQSWCEMVLRGLRDDCPEMRICKDALKMAIPFDYQDEEG